jgi:hypothetical protein
LRCCLEMLCLEDWFIFQRGSRRTRIMRCIHVNRATFARCSTAG